MALYRRGDPRWKVHPYQRACPKNGMWFSDVLDPIVWWQSWRNRQRIEDDLSGRVEIGKFIFRAEPLLWEVVGKRYISFGDDPLTGEQIKWLRKQIYGFLPQHVRDSLPSDIRRNYGPRRRGCYRISAA
ncbi:MAG: hypothetical protein KKD18_04560 [Nanoarchaeota archaeon]|nr:hypothetical protein [Nanoarchaeota archaeon]MBU0977662.1 hypothetical protein [Nanoarchaeota archaeon]